MNTGPESSKLASAMHNSSGLFFFSLLLRLLLFLVGATLGHNIPPPVLKFLSFILSEAVSSQETCWVGYSAVISEMGAQLTNKVPLQREPLLQWRWR